MWWQLVGTRCGTEGPILNWDYVPALFLKWLIFINPFNPDFLTTS